MHREVSQFLTFKPKKKDGLLSGRYVTWEAAVPPKKRAHEAPATNKHRSKRLSDTCLSVGACGVQPVCHAGASLFFFVFLLMER